VSSVAKSVNGRMKSVTALPVRCGIGLLARMFGG